MKDLVNFLLPLNLQFFAEKEGGEGDSETPQPKTFTEEQYNALLKERDNYKARNDELCRKEKEWKDKEKKNLSDEEQKKFEREEMEKRFKAIENENKSMKIQRELALGGFEEKDIENLTEHMISGDYDNLSKSLSTIFKEIKEKTRKEVIAELQKQNKIPNNGNNSNDNLDEDVQSYIDRNKKGSSTNARDIYLKKK